MPLSQALIDQFNRDGFLTVENVFKAEEIETLRRRTEDIANRVITTYPEADIEYEPGADRQRRLAAIRKLNRCDTNDAVFRDAARNPGILDVIESLLGPDIKLESEQLFMKPPGGIEKTYHQDGPYFSLDPISFVSAWIAMDDVTEENGCLRVIAGSHLLGPVPHSDVWMVGERRDMKIPEQFLDRSREVCIVMTAGSVSFHHSLVMHASGPNRSERSRRGLAVHYISSKSRWTGEPEKKPAYKLLRGQEYAGCV